MNRDLQQRAIMMKLTERVGRIEQQSRKLVRAMKVRKRVVALLPELLQ